LSPPEKKNYAAAVNHYFASQVLSYTASWLLSRPVP